MVVYMNGCHYLGISVHNVWDVTWNPRGDIRDYSGLYDMRTIEDTRV